jgi:hypothetical protein
MMRALARLTVSKQSRAAHQFWAGICVTSPANEYTSMWSVTGRDLKVVQLRSRNHSIPSSH